MRARSGRSTWWLAAFCLALLGPSSAPAARRDVPPFIPIHRQYLELPAGMQPLLPTFIANGSEILFQNAADGGAWVIRPDGTGLHCITCGLAGRPAIRGGFLYAFGDGKRLLLTQGVAFPSDSASNANAWILECAPNLRDCASHRFRPLDMSADRGPFKILQRRTWHLAPDGEHLGWMEVRTDGTVMIVARIERQGDGYVAAEPRVVNPPGPRGPADSDPDRWENLSQLYELKSFTPDGKGILAVGLPDNNVDVVRIDLATGRTRRLTANPDWDEDGSLSPDQKLFVVNSWRGQGRLDAIAWIPQVRGFTGLMVGAAIAPYYVSTWQGFQCDLSPWLLPARGDDGGRLVGQPVDVYDGDLTAANNVQGQQVWSPDGTMLLLQERTRSKGIAAPNRIAIARLDRAPSRPVSFVRTRIGAWALPAGLYRGPHAAERVVTVRGKAGGRAVITYRGTLAGGAATSVRFERFSDDGLTFVDGTMSGASGSVGSGEKRAWTLVADVIVSGRHTGQLHMDLTIDNAAKPLPAMTGSVSATYDGKVAPPLPALGPCYEAQPRPTPLRLSIDRRGRTLWVTVAADIHGDRRPVANADVASGAMTVRTDARGRAAVALSRAGGTDIVARAGDTFVAAHTRLAAD